MPEYFDPNKTSELVVFATPNGANTISSNGEGNFIGAQARELRESSKYSDKNLIVTYLSPNIRKWPNFLGQTKLNTRTLIDQTIQEVKSKTGQSQMDVSVEGHSGGGAFIFNMIDQGSSIPQYIKQINFYDAIYAYNGMPHALKIKKWLESDSSNQFNNITATSQISSAQEKFIADLKSLGVKFISRKESSHLNTLTAFDGRLKFTTMSEPDHGGAIKRDSFAYAHNPEEFTIAPLSLRQQTYEKLSKLS